MQPPSPEASWHFRFRFRPRNLSYAMTAVLVGVVSAQKTNEKSGGDYRVVLDSSTIALAVSDRGIPMNDFLKLAELTTGRSFVYEPSVLEHDSNRIRFVGTVRRKRVAFLEFVQTMLARKGFKCVPGPGPGDRIEVHTRRGYRASMSFVSAYVPVDLGVAAPDAPGRGDSASAQARLQARGYVGKLPVSPRFGEATTLDDTGATVEDLGRRFPFEFPQYESATAGS